MNFYTLLKNSLKLLKNNRRRTFLTVLGIIIGVAAVIIVMSVGAGAQSLIFDQINSVGSNLIGVLPGYSDENGPPASAFGVMVTTLKNDDVEAIKKVTSIEAATSYVRGVETASWQNQKVDATFVGTTDEYIRVEDAKLAMGDFFDETDSKSITREIVLGWQIYKDLFGDENPLGQKIKLKRESFRVIGVVEKRGTQGFQNQDTLVFIPLKTAQKIMLGIDHISMIRAKVADEKEIPAAIAQVEQILREEHNIKESQEDDFTVRATTEALDALKVITDALKFFLSGIAAISLLVGGIGIMNIMLVTVTERTREIGLRKAIGATKEDIQSQFLFESILITLTGGGIGIIFGVAFSALIAVSAHYLGYNWNFVVTIWSVLLGVGVSGFIGIIFGWYPARKASLLDPIVALRYE
ncbi:multidrug ABC transporter substrate-binding protein [Candidatus Falkowbacteria bacterium CG10_big_fil_rev_8_21_14_0_10_37_6]|uniref:Multidrug ABC transporter substrate-binding protein n=1 Tax=Candidatus Falkowbacteria bacterium CG10_big_fil_rev_8_21_14_0_10_37_6 TaxID=1974563 RepID=A0A2H0V6L5_9BACT|nr:MAG: multidrug ABC transporter substrate-binding protein [Candidatus Falkowbacteria bacterium CG10_big_fil_rev_8_21_14_0_10_37_6]